MTVYRYDGPMVLIYPRVAVMEKNGELHTMRANPSDVYKFDTDEPLDSNWTAASDVTDCPRLAFAVGAANGPAYPASVYPDYPVTPSEPASSVVPVAVLTPDTEKDAPTETDAPIGDEE